jgi:hypothetical protein
MKNRSRTERHLVGTDRVIFGPLSAPPRPRRSKVRQRSPGRARARRRRPAPWQQGPVRPRLRARPSLKSSGGTLVAGLMTGARTCPYLQLRRSRAPQGVALAAALPGLSLGSAFGVLARASLQIARRAGVQVPFMPTSRSQSRNSNVVVEAPAPALRWSYQRTGSAARSAASPARAPPKQEERRPAQGRPGEGKASWRL